LHSYIVVVARRVGGGRKKESHRRMAVTVPASASLRDELPIDPVEDLFVVMHVELARE
jgi:hypothetical protein